MKITFVNPYYQEPLVLKYLGLPSIPLGFAYVIAVMEQAGYQVEVIDAFGYKLSTAQTIEELKKTKPDVTAITAVTCNIDIAKEIALEARKFSLVIMGGTQISLDPECVVDYCDYAVAGEGEKTLPELLSASNKEEVKGIIFKKDGKIISTPLRPFTECLDELPFPARHKFPLHRYRQFGVMPLGTMLSSRGCPHGCAYCTIGTLFPTWRGRSPKNVVDEMEELVHRFDCRGISFADEDFLLSKERAQAIAEEILRRGLKVMWGIQTRTTNIGEKDLELLKSLRRAGCQFALFGIESARVGTMKKLRRDIKLKTIQTAFETCKKADMRTAGSAILGFPGETKEDARFTVKFVKELDPCYAFFGVATPFPGTPFYQICRDSNIIKERNLRKYTIMSPVLETETISSKQANQLLNMAYRSFYFRPSYILRRIFYELFRLDRNTTKGFLKWSWGLSLDSKKISQPDTLQPEENRIH